MACYLCCKGSLVSTGSFFTKDGFLQTDTEIFEKKHLRKQKAAVKHSQTTRTFHKKSQKQQGQPGATILYMQKNMPTHEYLSMQHISKICKKSTTKE